MADEETPETPETPEATAEPPAGPGTGDADAPDDVAAAQERAARAESALWRERAVSAAGIPSALADRLKGDTEAELKADAVKLSQMLSGSAPANMRTRPQSTAGPGASQGGESVKDDAVELAKRIRSQMDI